FVCDVSGGSARSPRVDGPREASAPAAPRSRFGELAAAPDARAIPVPAGHRGILAADAGATQRDLVHRAAFRQAAHVQSQDRFLGPGLAHVRRAVVRTLAVRLARTR